METFPLSKEEHKHVSGNKFLWKTIEKRSKLVVSVYVEFFSVVYGTRTEAIIFGTFLFDILVCLSSLDIISSSTPDGEPICLKNDTHFYSKYSQLSP
jgi:hypothetical protein